jgi:hypothetical protein
VDHKRTKHIDIRHHWIREQVAAGNIKPIYISTDEMVADVMTKPLDKVKHYKFSTAMGLTLH